MIDDRSSARSRLEADERRYEAEVRRAFSFLETGYGMTCFGLRDENVGNRDYAKTVSYDCDSFGVQIWWGVYEFHIVVLVDVKIQDLRRRERIVNLELFVEFLTKGSLEPILPTTSYSDGYRKLLKTVQVRSVVFDTGLDKVLDQLAGRLRTHLPDILDAPPDAIQEYRAWYTEHYL